MYWFELLDIMFLVHTLKNPPDNFDIYDHITFTNSDVRSTRSSAVHHLQRKHCRTSYGRHFYFNRIVRLWNAVPPIDISLSEYTIKPHLMDFLWSHFEENFDSNSSHTFHFLCPCSICHFTHPSPITFS